jgi:hypothetical protein
MLSFSLPTANMVAMVGAMASFLDNNIHQSAIITGAVVDRSLSCF